MSVLSRAMHLSGGPQIENPLSSPADVDALVEFDPAAGEHAVYEAIRICTAELAGTKPLIGFAGAPYTLACYAIEGKSSKDWSQAKTFLHRHPEAADALLSKLAESAARHLQAQIDAGASVVQIFDSWAGSLGREDFETFSKPYITRIVDALTEAQVRVLRTTARVAHRSPLLPPRFPEADSPGGVPEARLLRYLGGLSGLDRLTPRQVATVYGCLEYCCAYITFYKLDHLIPDIYCSFRSFRRKGAYRLL